MGKMALEVDWVVEDETELDADAEVELEEELLCCEETVDVVDPDVCETTEVGDLLFALFVRK